MLLKFSLALIFFLSFSRQSSALERILPRKFSYQEFLIQDTLLSPPSSGFDPFLLLNKGYSKEATLFIHKILQKMSLAEKIGQLFIASVPSKLSSEELSRISGFLINYHIGGISFLHGEPQKQYKLIGNFQKQAKYPLFIALDAENGLGMRIDSLIAFPKGLTLGAISDNELIYQMGVEIARESKVLGINLNFAPVLDVNDTPLNPIINERSFGDDPKLVALKGVAYMRGLQDGGIMAIAKHFPGHGSAETDSHVSLPLIQRERKALDSIDLHPFKELIKNGLTGIMVGHLNVPSLDPRVHLAASLSKPIVEGLLRNEFNFKGLIITDAMNMGGLQGMTTEMKDLKALKAGNDILLYPQDIPKTVKYIYSALDRGEISLTEIEAKVSRILRAKYALGLFDSKKDFSENKSSLFHLMNSSKAVLLKEKLVKASLTLLGNRNQILPLRNFEKEKMAVISLGEIKNNTFQRTLNKFAKFDQYDAWIDADSKVYQNLEDSLKSYHTVVVGLHNLEKSNLDNYGIRQSTLEFIQHLHNPNIILVVFGNPYLLSNFQNIPNVLLAYEDHEIEERLSAEVLFGAISPSGKLSVKISNQFQRGDGITYPESGRLQYSIPEELGIHSQDLLKVDSIALEGIKKHAYPGCVVLAAKDGKVFYEKAFGTHTYQDKSPTLTSDVFDLASVTKITATLLGVMKVYEQGLISMDDPIIKYLPELENTNKKDIILKDLLTHQAGLVPFIPFYLDAMKDPTAFKSDSSEIYSYRVADHLFERNNYYRNTIWPKVLASPLKTPGKYVYSDLSMYLMRAVVEKVSLQDLKTLVANTFYLPLGLSTMGYNPRDHIPIQRIMPTENDLVFRKQLLIGDVHDPGAALQNGVGGHAGLFSNASDLAILGQMLLNQGQYAGRIYLRPETLKLFNTRPYPKTNRRGLGFDKPELDPEKYPALPKMVSSETFGHTGFTGTCIWIDPQNKLIYIFLSNRICPDVNNTALSSLSIRPKIQAAFYEALNKAQK